MGIHKRAALLVTCILCLAFCCAYSQESKPTVRHHRVMETVPDDDSSPEVEQAETAMQRGDFATAESLLQKAVAAKPADYRAWFDLGYVYNATNRIAEATDAYRKSVAAKPDVFESNLNLGLLLARQGKNAEAATYLKAATQLKPTANPDAALARTWQALGRVEESADAKQAAAAYAEAAKLDPKNPEPHLAAADLFEKQGDLDGAARQFQTASNLDAKSQPALSGLANVYIKQKKYPEAEAALRKALAADPLNNTARYQLGLVLAEEGKNDEAADEVKKSLQAGGNCGAELTLGSLYVKTGNDAEAEHWLRGAVAGFDSVLKICEERSCSPGSAPPHPSECACSGDESKAAEAHYALGSLLMHVKKYPESQQELLLAVQLKPDLADAYGNLAVVAAENKNYPLTLRALDYRAKFLPEGPATYFLRATTFDNLKAVPQAVEYYQRFLAADAGKLPDQEWQARHRLIALDPKHADKYQSNK